MNKPLLYLIVCLTFFFTACSNNNKAEVVDLEPENELKTAQLKPRKQQHKGLPEGVISLDIFNDNNRLHLLTGHHQQGQKTLWYRYSDNDGNSWSTAVKILNDDNLPAKIVRGNDAQIAAQGNTIVVSWMKYTQGVRFNAGPMLTVRSSDGGQTWKYANTPPDWKKGPHGYIDMIADDQAIHAVWLDSRQGPSEINASQALQYARSNDGGLSWQSNKTLDDLTCSCCWNTIKTDTEGNAYVLYRDKQPSDLAIGVINREQEWQRLSPVGAFNWQFEGCPHIAGGLDFQKTAGKKRLHSVVGTGHQEHLGIHYLYSDDAGKNWSAAKQLGNESAIHADIAAHDDGRVATVWDMMGSDGLTVFVAESIDQGANWSSPRQISKTGMRATHPRIIKTESGFLALWTENDGLKQTLATRVL